MTIVIYTGLSINFSDARRILDAEYHPPVKRGDINDLVTSRDDVEIIGIIDGVFHQSPAVSHKEILKALDKGITVVGGASMGALRACELYPYGMIGIGSIFNDYKTGVIDSDDDVAVSLNPDTLEQVSESYINIKYNLERAVDEEIITPEQEQELLHITKDTYYPKRSFKYILDKSSLEQETKDTLTIYIDKSNYDIKTIDATAVIEYIKKLKEKKRL